MSNWMSAVLVNTIHSFILVNPIFLTVLFWKMEFICGCSKITNLTSEMGSSYSDVGEDRVFW
jgi:hypothetical protein